MRSNKTGSTACRGPGWLQVSARVAAALPGGYVAAVLATMLLARVLPMPRTEASMAATLASFAVYAAIALWAFAARSAVRLWLWLLAAMAALGTATWLSILTGGRA